MAKKNILLICGGGSTEHEISLISANYLFDKLNELDKYNIFKVVIEKDGKRIDQHGKEVELRRAGEIFWKQSKQKEELHFAIPCIHGPPGENGHIQSVFEMMGLPYLGCNPEANQNCFNKVTTKLWFDALGIPNTPYTFISSKESNDLDKAHAFFDEHKDVFVKAASQGSSVGCYHVTKKEDLTSKIIEALKYSKDILIEKTLKGRELEIAAYENNGNIQASLPGEIICPDGFYTYEEKYDSKSHTSTDTVAKNVSTDIANQMRTIAMKAFTGMKLRHLSRIDFFLTEDNHILLNEINTFPGMTPISMFPKMMENDGLKFTQFLDDIIQNEAR